MHKTNDTTSGDDEAAPRFPKPEPASAFTDYKVYTAPGDPLRLPREDWDGARRRVVDDPAWAPWLAQRRADVDTWIAERQDRVEWVAGWWHDFISPKDGSFLTWTPDEPGAQTLSSPSDPKVTLTPKLHGAWVYRFRGAHGEKMLEAAQLYRLTGEAKYATWAASQLDFYADNFERWPLQHRGNGIWVSQARLMHQPLDEAVNLIRHVHAARLLGDLAAPEQKQRWFDRLFAPQTELMEASFQNIHNIACWQRSAVGHVALLYDNPSLWHTALDAPFGIRNQLARGVTSDYLWHEQSLGYNGFVVQALLPLFTYAALEGRANELRHEMAVTQNLMLAPIALRFPTGQLPNPADSGPPGRAPNLGFLASMYRVFPTTLGLQEAARGRSWNTLLDPPTPPTTDALLPPVTSRNLESSRMAVLRKSAWQVYLHYGQLLSSHSQREALHFEAFYGDTDITHDPGTVGYGSPLHREYYTTSLAHNVPLVDGHGQEGWHEGELLAFDGDAGRVAARQPQYRSDARAERELRIEGKRLIDTVRLTTVDAAGSDAPRRLALALHLQGQVDLPNGFVDDPTFAAREPAAFGYWSNVRSAPFQDTATFAVVFAGQKMRVTFTLPGRFVVYHGLSPDAPPARRDSFYVEVGGRAAEFVTVIEPVIAAPAGEPAA